MDDSSSRWQLAQNYEKNWWSDRRNDISFTYLKHYAEELVLETKDYITITDTTRILEIGCGPAGILTFLPSRNRYAIDPLEDHFSSIENFVSNRDKSIQYKKAMGEDLPYEDLFFDFIIMDNVLDHSESPEKVIEEMHRVLKQGGIVYFRQNTYHLWGKFIRELLEKAKIDKGHPHTFLKSYLERQLSGKEFVVLKRKSRGYYSAWISDLKSSRIIDKFKALLGITRDKTLYILKKDY
jgi:SAM-dependent methyltransferase